MVLLKAEKKSVSALAGIHPVVPLLDVAIIRKVEVPALKKATVGHFLLSFLTQN